MPLIPNEQIEQVREQTDIVQLVAEVLPLQKAGRNFKACCPFHQEKTASFVVSPEKQIFHCFGCGAGGNVFHFLMQYEGIEFVEAVRALAEQAGVKIQSTNRSGNQHASREQKVLKRVNRLAAEYYFNQLHKSDSEHVARRYLKDRALDDEICKRYLLGYAPEGGRALVRHLESRKVPPPLMLQAGVARRGRDGSLYDFFRHRLIFPIRNGRGDFIGFGGRVIDTSAAQQPKYLNTAESPVYHKGREVYGRYEGRAALRDAKQVFLVEGYTDVLALAQAGIANVVAPLGTALTADQIRLLRRQVQELVLVFDGDTAGLRAAWRAVEIVTSLEMPTRILVLPPGEDPDSFIRAQGVEEWRRRALAAPGLLDYFIDEIVMKAGKDSLGRLAASKKLLPLLGRLGSEVEKTLYIQKVADRVGLPAEALRQELDGKSKTARNFRSGPADDIDAQRHVALRLNPFERDLLRALLSNEEAAHDVLEEIKPEDWQDPQMRSLWPHLEQGLKTGRSFAEILGDITDEAQRQQLAGAFLANQGQIEGERDFVASCLKRLRHQHRKALQEALSRQIREAEAANDSERVTALLKETNKLLGKVDQEVYR